MLNLTKRETRFAIDALTMLRRQANNGEIHYAKYGICSNLWHLLSTWETNGNITYDEHVHIHAALTEHMAEWPEGTGGTRYPIPSSYKHSTACDQYHSKHNLWGGKQRKYRIALMRWLLKELKG